MRKLNRDVADAARTRVNERRFSFLQMDSVDERFPGCKYRRTGRVAAPSMERFLGLNAR
jgi:hypothetical protein